MEKMYNCSECNKFVIKGEYNYGEELEVLCKECYNKLVLKGVESNDN